VIRLGCFDLELGMLISVFGETGFKSIISFTDLHTHNRQKKPSPLSNTTVIGDCILRPKTATCSETFGRPNDCYKQIHELMFSGNACHRNAIFFEAKC